MNHGSLFSGIGGFDLASEWMGWNNVFHCEIEPFPRKVLKYYWPNAISYEDIRETDFTIHRGEIDILTGGFPCQPYSVAGYRKGKEDDRHLWPEMLRAIRELTPSWIVGENVPGIISWNGGLVFEEVCIDLENEGYEVQPIVLPAASKDAPHKRDRVWFVAYRADTGFESVQRQGENGIHGLESASNSDSERWNNRRDNREERQLPNNINRNAEEGEPKRNRRKRGSGQFGEVRDATNAQRPGLEGKNRERMGEPTQFAEQTTSNSKSFNEQYDGMCKGESKIKIGRCNRIPGWQNFPTQPPVCGRDARLPSELDGITFSKWRNESIKGYGNAVVPQVVMQIFRVIEKMNEE